MREKEKAKKTPKAVDGFEPRIICFLCNWCSYSAADAAGRAQKAYPANVSVIKVMCSGRVDPQFIMKAFHDGADGVMVLGCHPGDCHYKKGNYQTQKRVLLLKKVLGQFGIEQERMELDWVSATEGDRFVETVTRMVERVRQLGPLERRA